MLASPRSAQQDAFVDFLRNREKRAYATIDRKLVGVAVTLRTQYGVVIDPEGTKSAQELLKTVAAGARSRSARHAKAPAMRLEVVRALVAKCSGDIFGVRDRAKALLGFAIAVRRAELAGLRQRNIAEETGGNGLLDDVRASKTGSLHGAGSVRCEPGNLTRTGMASVGRDGADRRPGPARVALHSSHRGGAAAGPHSAARRGYHRRRFSHGPCMPTCGGAMPTPATLASSRLRAADVPASAAKRHSLGGRPALRRDQEPYKPSWLEAACRNNR
ncbi:hypothetical protein ACFXPY_13875 [Streptomyces sp. NPDC059153]|uniref:hypothetical protein n=1 Tax=Streptomyces sp. NPDC059153 TaxID=3346743 RepID=UPI00368A43E8